MPSPRNALLALLALPLALQACSLLVDPDKLRSDAGEAPQDAGEVSPDAEATAGPDAAASPGRDASQPRDAGACDPLPVECTQTDGGFAYCSGACSVDGWCWMNPLPQGNDLDAVFAPEGSDEVWAAGARGTIVRFDRQCARFQIWMLSPADDLHAVSGSGSDDLWFVGDRGALIHWDGGGFTSHGDPALGTLRAVWSKGRGEILAAGDLGKIEHFTTSAGWSTLSTSGTPLFALDGEGEEIWAVGAAGNALRSTPGGWSSVPVATTADLRAVRVVSPNEVWLTGDRATLWRWNGSQALDARCAYDGGVPDYRAAAVDERGVLWLGGSNGNTFVERVREGTCERVGNIYGQQGVHAVAATGAGPLLVGRAGYFYSGNVGPADAGFGSVTWTDWQQVKATVARSPLNGVWGSGESDVWAVGPNGIVLQYDGTRVRSRAIAVGSGMAAVSGTAPGQPVAVGVQGYGRTVDGGIVWTSVNCVGFSSVFATADGEIAATSSRPTCATAGAPDAGVLWLASPDAGGDFRPVVGLPSSSPTAVWGRGGGSYYVAAGDLCTCTAAGCSECVSPQHPIQAISGTSREALAVGDLGVTYQNVGTVWARVSSATDSLEGLWMRPSSDLDGVAWAVGSAGYIGRWSPKTATGWVRETSGVQHPLNGVYGVPRSSDGGYDLWVVGGWGTVLRKR